MIVDVEYLPDNETEAPVFFISSARHKLVLRATASLDRNLRTVIA